MEEKKQENKIENNEYSLKDKFKACMIFGEIINFINSKF